MVRWGPLMFLSKRNVYSRGDPLGAEDNLQWEYQPEANALRSNLVPGDTLSTLVECAVTN